MTTRQIPRPAAGDHPPYHGSYIELVPDGNVLALLEKQGLSTAVFLRGIGEAKSQHRYAAGKWSIREVVGHLTDAERVFSYRALSFARGDTNPLPGFEETAWAATSNAEQRTLADHIADYSALRLATLTLFRGFSDTELVRAGVASGHRVTVGALAYVIAGHERHHLAILKDRYLSP
jgi:hypothetical protein